MNINKAARRIVIKLTNQRITSCLLVFFKAAVSEGIHHLFGHEKVSDMTWGSYTRHVTSHADRLAGYRA